MIPPPALFAEGELKTQRSQIYQTNKKTDRHSSMAHHRWAKAGGGMKTFLCITAIGLTGFYSITTPPHGGVELTQPQPQFLQPQQEAFRVQVTPRLIVIQMEGPVKIKNLAPKCSLYYGLEGEPLKVGEGVAQVDQNEVKPQSEKIIMARRVLSLICAPGQAFPIEIKKVD